MNEAFVEDAEHEIHHQDGGEDEQQLIAQRALEGERGAFEARLNALRHAHFALDAERTRGLATRDAIFEACLLRFRPILMTTLAAMLGALPLALGAGDGAEMRRPLGIAIVGGLLFSQILTLYTTPVVYLYLDRLRLLVNRRSKRRSPGTLAAPVTD